MGKPDPSSWAPTRPGQRWSYSVLKAKVDELAVWWKANGKGGTLTWEFWLDRKLDDGEGNPITQALTEAEFRGESSEGQGQKWPIPGIYYADCKVDGQSVLREPWQGIHLDEDARAERRGGESIDQVVRQSVSDQFSRLNIEIAGLRRQLDGTELRTKKLQRENDEYVDALAEKDKEILALRRERDADKIAREEAELKMEAAIEEKLALQDDIESMRLPLKMVGAGFVEEAFDALGVPKNLGSADDSPESVPEAVRAAAERITLAVLRCPEAQEVLDMSVDPETGEPFWGPEDNPIDFLLPFLQAAQDGPQANGGHRGHRGDHGYGSEPSGAGAGAGA